MATPRPGSLNLDTIYDEGLALERTMLAWQRTVLALAVIGAVVTRYSPMFSGIYLPVVFGAVAVIAAFGLLFWVRWRYNKTNRALHTTGNLEGRDGKPLIVVVALMVFINAGVLWFVIAR